MSSTIQVARGRAGALTYAVPVPPERIPMVPPADLLAAWALARRAADQQLWGPPRLLVFARPDAEPTEIAIADADAGCWAEAIDTAIGLGSLPGLAICLRLLALVELLTRAPELAPLYDVTPDGIALHPALLSAAATMPLDSAAQFDAAGLRGLLSRPLPADRARRRIA